MATDDLMKKCTRCQQEKPLSDFHRQRLGYLGRRATCKQCRNTVELDLSKVKVCSSCGTSKRISDFYKQEGGIFNVSAKCKECIRKEDRLKNFTFDEFKFGHEITCAICKIRRHHSEFSNDKSNPNGKSCRCKKCVSEIRKPKENFRPSPNYKSELKTCSKCNIEKSGDHFYLAKGNPDGLSSQCRECLLMSAREKDYKPSIDYKTKEKQCSKCGKFKFGSEFGLCKSSLDGLSSDCKDCKSERNDNKFYYPEKNYESIPRRCSFCGELKLGSEFSLYKNSKDGLKSQCKECDKRYSKDNPGYFTAYARAREAMKINALPKWCDKKNLDSIYEECVKTTRESGVAHHVDHIVPLKSKWVCGLHCEDNLRIIPATENLRKHNSTWPDMVDKKDRSVAATKENLARIAKRSRV